ncbi:MAG: carboxypeptidase regulatory-like domain-containing protein [Planctomycetota bacterium]|nr:carboxypeptidase regulatory-like domain-containing protein [Planctomycetota bacterium]
MPSRLLKELPLYGALALCLCAMNTRAQEGVDRAAEPQRKPLIGQFLDPEGKPIANAEVTVAWNPNGVAALGPAASAKGRTSKRGYFAVRAPIGTILAVWALGPPDEDGNAWISEPAEAAIGIQRFEIHANKRRGSARTVTVEGLDAWAELAPFRLQLHPCPFVDLTEEFPIDENHQFEMPLIPAGYGRCVVLTRDGQPVSVGSAPTVGSTIRIHAPHKIQIVSLDPDGEPVAGVTIHHRVGFLHNYNRGTLDTSRRAVWRVAGETDAAGRCEIVLAQRRDPFEEGYARDIILRGSKAGYADSHSGREGDFWFTNGKKLAEDETNQPLTVRMAKAEALEGRFSLPPAQRPDHAHLSWTSKIQSGDNSWYHLPRNQRIAVNADGSFALQALPQDAHNIRVQVPPTEWTEGSDTVRLPIALFPSEVRPTPGWDPAPAELRRIDFQATRADGTPCQGATAVLGPSYRSLDLRAPAVHIALDITGRGSALVPKDRSKWAIAIIQPSGYAAKILGPDDSSAQLQLQPFEELHGRVVDKEGQPVAGARIDIHKWSQSGSSNNPTAKLREEVADWAQHRYAKTTSDAQGMFVMRFLSMPNRKMHARATANNRLSDSFLVEPQEEPLELVLQGDG